MTVSGGLCVGVLPSFKCPCLMPGTEKDRADCKLSSLFLSLVLNVTSLISNHGWIAKIPLPKPWQGPTWNLPAHHSSFQYAFWCWQAKNFWRENSILDMLTPSSPGELNPVPLYEMPCLFMKNKQLLRLVCLFHLPKKSKLTNALFYSAQVRGINFMKAWMNKQNFCVNKLKRAFVRNVVHSPSTQWTVLTIFPD